MRETVYSQLISKLRRGELTPAQQAELDAIRLIADIDLNDPFWLHFLPMFFISTRTDDEKINTAALLEAIQGIGSGRRTNTTMDMDALAEGIAARLQDQLPNPDPVVIGRAVAKAATPAIQQAVENATTGVVQQPKVDHTALQSVFKEVSRDALLNRNVGIVVLAGILMSGIGVGWGGYQSDQQWRPVVSQLQDQVKQLQDRDRQVKPHHSHR